MYPKWLLASKTFLFNAATIIVALVVELTPFGPDLGLDPKWILMANAFVNIYLRLVTKAPVTLMKSDAGGALSSRRVP